MPPNNPLPIHGNERTMNLNSMILTNIQSSPYFKVNLFELKTYHQVIDEIYYKVDHLEPWEKGSRKTAGQTGMCGGVRGVGAGGIVSSAYCLLYKLFTLKLTKKQVIGLITHNDSTYIRALGFMYIRYTQNPADLWEWYEDYLEDEEELDVKAGTGHVMQMGEMLRQWMTKLEWYSTLFPRIPVPIQKQLESKLKEYERNHQGAGTVGQQEPEREVPRVPADKRRDIPEDQAVFGEAERISKLRESPQRSGSSDRRRDNRPSPPFDIAKEIDREKVRQPGHVKSRDHDSHRHRSRSKDRYHKKSQDKDRHRHRSRSRERKRSRSRDRKRSRSRDRKRSRSQERHRHRDRERGHRESSFDRDLRREKARVKNGR